MTALPERWRVYLRRDPDDEARLLKRRFQAVSRGYDRAVRLRRAYRTAKVVGVSVCFLEADAPQSVATLITLRHVASYPNCDAARAVGLAPAYRGQPGYWLSHDRDQDGWSCEPWPGR